jgi:hypothetical protein
MSFISVVLTLTACSGGAPSDSEIKIATEKAAAGTRFKVEYTSVKKIGCKDDGEKAYRCDVEFGMKMAGQDRKEIASLRFVKGSDGWIAMK